MKEYRVTIWEGSKKYCYRMGSTNIKSYEKTLKEQYNRYTIEELQHALPSL